ncbi:hypothetical protein K435DRAFT_874919 [Dendrothele bispora CBS 962.96]|uniref:Uncharacterized protein n=1 Tax=Dendrothele bispora (strain CBS 962.96) TaxID=1314807 RepID=A0A4S8KVV5_DENBC|nr:hypothetical protein K435DRAFT_874919 [Dendrothele bispora CBS 962.96]
MSCLSDNTQTIDQSSFWESGSLNWDAHRLDNCGCLFYCNHLFMLRVPTLPVCVPRLPLSVFSRFLPLKAEICYIQNIYQPAEQRQMYVFSALLDTPTHYPTSLRILYMPPSTPSYHSFPISSARATPIIP